MVLHNPNNWHWVSKDVSAWTKDWLAKDLGTISAEQDGISAKVDSVVSMDGDVDVSQRKGKVITIFDVKLKLEYADIYSDAPNKQSVKDLVRSKLVPQIREHLQKLGPALIAEHGKDIQHAPGSNPSSGFSTPKYVQSSSINKSDSPALGSTSSTQGSGALVNVVSIHETSEFRTSAEELYKTFTDPQRLAAFTRSPPKVFTGAQPGGKFELFGGNVSGEYTTLEVPTRIVQKWRLAQWPQGHYSTLEIKFDQNDIDHVTNMRVQWDGVPAGQEDVTKTNWDNYYVRSIKTTFGFGTVL